MPEITTKAAVNEIPRTTVDEAIRRGRRKVQESRILREKQEAARPVQQSAVPTAGMEQGDMLDPFNFTTALRMMDGRGRNAVETSLGESPKKHRAAIQRKWKGEAKERRKSGPMSREPWSKKKRLRNPAEKLQEGRSPQRGPSG